jgi:hypothetical protein
MTTIAGKRATITAILLASMTTTIALATQLYQSPTLNYCIREFFDPSLYNWLSFENSCSESLSVTYIGYNPPHARSSADIGPGRKASTGLTKNEVAERGGFELYVCRSGYLPVDAADNYVSRTNVPYRCKGR